MVVGDGVWWCVVLLGGSFNLILLNGVLGLNMDDLEGDVQILDGSEKWFVFGKFYKFFFFFVIQCLQIVVCFFDCCDVRVVEVVVEVVVVVVEVGDVDDIQSLKGGDLKGGSSLIGEFKDSKSIVFVVIVFEEYKMQEMVVLWMWVFVVFLYC